MLCEYFQGRDVIVIGYSGWDDALMGALLQCDSSKNRIYWCGVDQTPKDGVAAFLEKRAQNTAYVYLQQGANALMRTLYQTLMESDRRPGDETS